MAGVPRCSLVVIAATLSQFNIPEAELLLILGVDTFLDMGRAATNAVGNSIANAVVAKWEGELVSEEEAQVQAQMHDRENAASMGATAKA
ncbi:Proton/sodium-glutamate symport protein [Pseudomonas fluorescens]|jgi:Na+/H+-dicarboxylate symporter|nr:Proton/sodium-glutamate symport protein [Pseudomonas fluorescens]